MRARYLLAGQTRLGMSQFHVARHDADEADRLNPNLAGLNSLRGMVQEQMADYDGAEASLLQALAADPKDLNAHYYLGAIYSQTRSAESSAAPGAGVGTSARFIAGTI